MYHINAKCCQIFHILNSLESADIQINLLIKIDYITVQFVNGKLNVGGTKKFRIFFDKMQKQESLNSQLSGITEEPLTLNPGEVSESLLSFMFQRGCIFVSEVGT